MNEKILLFILINGLQVPSEGTLSDIRTTYGALECHFFEAVHPVNKTLSMIYLPNVCFVAEVDRDSVQYAPSIIETPGKIKVH